MTATETTPDLQQITEDLGQTDLAPICNAPEPHDHYRLNGTGFENGRPVPVRDFDHGAIERTEHEDNAHDPHPEHVETLGRLLDFLTLGENSVNQIGWRAVILRHLINEHTGENPETQADLARRLRVSKARVSQALNSMRGQIAAYLRGV